MGLVYFNFPTFSWFVLVNVGKYTSPMDRFLNGTRKVTFKRYENEIQKTNMTPRALSTWFYIYILCAGPKIATSSFLVFASCVVMVTDMAKNANHSQPYRRHFLDIILTQFGHVLQPAAWGGRWTEMTSYECLHCSWLHGGFIYVTLMWCCIFIHILHDVVTYIHWCDV